jgi:hypothetical protein
MLQRNMWLSQIAAPLFIRSTSPWRSGQPREAPQSTCGCRSITPISMLQACRKFSRCPAIPYCILTDPMKQVVAQPVADQKQSSEDLDRCLFVTADDRTNQLGIIAGAHFGAQAVEIVRELAMLKLAVPEMGERGAVRLHVQETDRLKRHGDF